jgi:serine/threonine protein phosphatase PrpC
MNCPACGTDNREGAHFCKSCGAALPSPAAPAAAPVEGLETALQSQEQPVATLPTPSQDRAAAAQTEGAPSEDLSNVVQGAESLPGEPEPAGTSPSGESAPVEAGEEVQAQAEGAALQEEAMAQPEGEQPADQLPPSPPVAPTESRGTQEAPSPPEWVQEDMTEPLPEPEAGLEFWREEGKPLAPASPGSHIADRYAVVKILDAGDDGILYLADDLQTCWQCGFDKNTPGEAYCVQCGASLDHWPQVQLLEVQGSQTEPDSGQPVAARLMDHDRAFLVLAETQPEPSAPGVSQGLRLVVGQGSDPGQVRELNEDSLLTLTLAPTYESRIAPALGLFAIADGMGGHEGGEVASKMALQILAEQILRTIFIPEMAAELLPEQDMLVHLRQAVVAANDSVFLARNKRENNMGTTLTAVLIRDDRLFLAHVGDSRAYRWNASGLVQLTTDHSVVASMVASGQAAPDEIYTHPHRSIIYRSIGDRSLVDIDSDVLPLSAGDWILVCSDGLWEAIRNEGIEEVLMQESDPQAACDSFIRRANLAGGEDNISVIAIQVAAV